MKNRLRSTLACLLLGGTTLLTFPAVAQAAPSPAPDTVPVVTADGTPAPVHFFDSPPPGIGTGTGKGSGTTPSSSSPSAEVQGGTGLARTGNIKVTLITAQLADRSASDTAAIPIDAAKSSIAAASRYWQTMSNGRLSMSVGSVRTGVQTSATSGQSYAQIMSTLTRELGWVSRPYEAMVIFIPTGSLSGGALGAGWSSDATGGRILMPLPGPYTDSVVSHEFGHVLGLMHADSLQCGSGVSDVGGNGNGGFADPSCSIREYGDTMDLMGATRSIMPAISSSFWDYGGFGRGDEILDAGTAVGTKSYTLSAWAGTAARRAVKFTDPISGETYYLELRLPVGYDTEAAQGGNRGVKIVQQGGATAASSLVLMPSTKPFPGYYATNHAWQAGQTFTTHAGTSVSIDWISDTAASVTVRSKSPYASYFKFANRDAIYGKRNDGTFKALNWQEYSSLGTPAFATLPAAYFVQNSWNSNIYLVGADKKGNALSFAEWDSYGRPAPTVSKLLAGTWFYSKFDDAGLYYASPAGETPATTTEWKAAGSPTLVLPVRYVKYPWEDAIYKETATSLTASKATAVNYTQWAAAGFPNPQNSGYIPGSKMTKYSNLPNIYLKSPSGTSHELNYTEWMAVPDAKRTFTGLGTGRFVKNTWNSAIYLVGSDNKGSQLNFAQWASYGMPTPTESKLLTGTSFYRKTGSTTLYYASPAGETPATTTDWKAAGSPTVTTR